MRLPVLAVHQALVAAIDIDAPEKSSEASMLKLKKKLKKPNGVVDYDPTSVLDMFIDADPKEAKGPGGAKTDPLLEHVSTITPRPWMTSRARHLISAVLSISSQRTVLMCCPRKSKKDSPVPRKAGTKKTPAPVAAPKVLSNEDWEM